MAAATCTECGSTLSADGECPNCEENEAPESKPAGKAPAFGGKKAPAFGAAAAAPKAPAQKWMDTFAKK